MRLGLYLLISLATVVHGLLDPISLTVGAGIAGLLGWKFDTVKKHTYCRFEECCDETSITLNNITALRDELVANLFGQHIVIESILSSLKMHFKKGDHASKPLVISFHGTPGTGKNYVADFIAKSMYKRGLDSKYVHRFFGRLDFPEESKAAIYGIELRDKIKKAVSKCAQSLFIFDEVDKTPPGVFDTITSLFDHHSSIHGLDFRQSIFIFLTNTGGPEIAEKLQMLETKGGIFREETKLNDFEKICELGAYNIKGGLQNAAPIEAGVIDHFIPFLPLEKRHVEKCIQSEFHKLYVVPSKEKIAKVMETVTFGKGSLFASYGCKRLDKKVQLVANQS